MLGIVCALLVGSFLEAKPLFNEVKTTLLEVNDKSGVIADSADFVVGSSGIILHKFDAKTTSIIARFDVVSKSGGKATLRFEKFDMLAQGAFPNTGIKPVVGDEIIVNYLYERILAVTPNQNVYNEITKKYRDMTWIHPDLVSGYLTKIFRPNPDKAIFQKACYQNSASLIFFAIQNKGYFVDCHNFNTLQTVDIADKSNEIQLPFYSRIKATETSWFVWDSGKIGDYNTYYTSLIRK